jgi:sn-glycerol 3-phosphate transport system permease protein
MMIFWLIFITLMLPLEVRIVPTYAVAANVLLPYQSILDITGISWLIAQVSGVQLNLQWGLLDSYAGLILPLVATATGTFLYRQFFLTLPDELVEAAKMDGAGPIRFFFDVLLPLSRTNMAALFTIMFVWAWNEYLWPLLITTDASHAVAVVGLRDVIPGVNGVPEWNIAMAATLIVMLPPLIVVALTQRFFVRGLVATEKCKDNFDGQHLNPRRAQELRQERSGARHRRRDQFRRIRRHPGAVGLREIDPAADDRRARGHQRRRDRH